MRIRTTPRRRSSRPVTGSPRRPGPGQPEPPATARQHDARGATTGPAGVCAPARCRSLSGTSLARNSTHLMLAAGVNLALGYVYWVVAARLYTAHDVGVAAALIAAFSLAWVVSSLGVGNFVVQTMSRRATGHEWSSTLNAAVLAACITGLLAGVVLIGIGLALGSHAGLPARDPALHRRVRGRAHRDDRDRRHRQGVHRRAAQRATAGAQPRVLAPARSCCSRFPSSRRRGRSAWPGRGSSPALASMLVSVWLLRGLRRGYRISPRGTRVLLAPVLRRAFGHHVVSVGNLAPGYVLPLLVAAMLSATQSAYFFTTWRVGGVFFIISAAVGTSLFADASRPDGDLARGGALERQADHAPARPGHRLLRARGQVDPGHPRRGVRPARLLPAADHGRSPRFPTPSRTSTSPSSACSTGCASPPPSRSGWRSRPWSSLSC